MAIPAASLRLIPVLGLAFLVMIFPVHGQGNSSCSASNLARFTPCINFVTNSTSNGTTPSVGCCDSLRSLTNGSVDCFCLIATGNVPLQVPINQTLAISLPRACNMPGVPLQCKASIAPIPAPGPAAFRPTLSPSPKASTVPVSNTPALAPEADTPTSVGSEAPTSSTETHPAVAPSAAVPSNNLSPSLLLAFAVVAFKFC